MAQRLRQGKASELQVFGRLMGAGLDVYSTVADDQGIDAVVRVQDSSGKPHYFDIQVKSAGSWYGFRRVFADKLEGRDNLVFVFFNTTTNELIWLWATELSSITPVWATAQTAWGPVQFKTDIRVRLLQERTADTLREELLRLAARSARKGRGSPMTA